MKRLIIATALVLTVTGTGLAQSALERYEMEQKQFWRDQEEKSYRDQQLQLQKEQTEIMQQQLYEQRRQNEERRLLLDEYQRRGR